MSSSSEIISGMSNGTSADGESTIGRIGVQQTLNNEQQPIGPNQQSSETTSRHQSEQSSIMAPQQSRLAATEVICISDTESDDDQQVTSASRRTMDDSQIDLLSSSSEDDISELSSSDETALYYSAFAQSTLAKSSRARPASAATASLSDSNTSARFKQAKKRTRLQRKADRAALRTAIGKGGKSRKQKKVKLQHHPNDPANFNSSRLQPIHKPAKPFKSPRPPKTKKSPKARSINQEPEPPAHGVDGPILLQCANRMDTVTIHRNHSLEGVNHVVLCDLDNWRNFYLRMPFHLPNDVFIHGFASLDTIKHLKVPDDAVALEAAGADGVPDEELVTLSPFTRLLAAHRIQLTTSGCSANAADFAMSFVGGLLHASLPLHVSFTILSGDRGLEESVRMIKMQGRECRRIDPHALTVKGDSVTTDQLIFHTLSSLISSH